MNHTSRFASTWNDYRRRRRWFFGVWLGGFIIVASLAAFLAKLSLGDLAFAVLAPAWGLAFVVVAVRLQFFLCPRCHRHFSKAFWYGNPFARKCVHCGLPKWSESDLQKTHTA
jgi:4-amino-4-deoxy-L-arabinose transferase-like glycosyltransferase